MSIFDKVHDFLVPSVPVSRAAWNLKDLTTGDVVIAFNVRGSMGEDHVFEWMGQVTSFDVQAPPAQAMEFARVAIIKRGNKTSSDGPLGVENVFLDSRDLQYLAVGLWVYYR